MNSDLNSLPWRSAIFTMVLSMLFWSLGVHASSVDLHIYDLDPLSGSETPSFESLRGKIDTLVFFEPECSWCFKQARVLNKLQQDCRSFGAAAIGVNGSIRDLKKTVQSMRLDFYSYQINSELQKDLGKVEATPLLIFLNEQGEYASYVRGYQNRDKLGEILRNLNPNYCS
ncbi:MAG: hypothetical protein MK188_08795 [Gammaproteobacteria bacterium]|nr:hypothetical protein [Gammaproteobacteria bacterium]